MDDNMQKNMIYGLSLRLFYGIKNEIDKNHIEKFLKKIKSENKYYYKYEVLHLDKIFNKDTYENMKVNKEIIIFKIKNYIESLSWRGRQVMVHDNDCYVDHEFKEILMSVSMQPDGCLIKAMEFVNIQEQIDMKINKYMRSIPLWEKWSIRTLPGAAFQ